MPTLVDIEGYEHQVTVSNATTTMNPKLWDTVSQPAQLSFVTGRDGIGKALRVTANGAATRVQRTYTTASTLKVISFYVKIVTLPSATSRAFGSVTDINCAFRIKTDGQADCVVGSTGAPGGPILNVGQWYRIDMRIDSNPATHTIDWAVDGVAQTQAAAAGTAASTQTAWYSGTNTTETYTIDYDDVVVSDTTGDYPLGRHTVYSKVPSADGSYANVGTNIMENASTGADISASETAWSKLDDWPPTTGLNNADSVTSKASGATNYAEVTFSARPSYATSTAWGVTGVVAHQSDTTGANTGITRITDSAGTTLTDIFSGDMSEITDHYTRKLITPPVVTALITQSDAGGGTQTVDGLTTTEARAQTFTLATRTSITAVDLWAAKNATPADNLVLDIVSTLGGTSLGSATRAGSGLSTTAGWVRFTFTTPVWLAAGNYYLQVTRSGAGDSSNYYKWYISATDVYAGQERWVRSSGSWSVIASPVRDHAFSIYEGWSTTDLDGVKGRVGFGTLQPGEPEWLALMLQVATPDVPVTVTPQAVAVTTTCTVGLTATKVPGGGGPTNTPVAIAVTPTLTAALRAGIKLENTFNGGTDEATITTSDTGSGDAFNAVTIGGGTGGEVKYDSAFNVAGGMGARITPGSTGVSGVAWSTAVSETASWVRFYLKVAATGPAGVRVLCQFRDATNTTVASIRHLDTSSHIGIYDSAGTLRYQTSVGPTSGGFAAGDIVRVEGKVVHSTTNGHLVLRIFYGANLHGTTSDQEVGNETDNWNTGTIVEEIRFGVFSNAGETYAYDEVAWSSIDWIGPVSVGGATFNQAVDAAATVTAALVRGVGKPIAAAATFTAGLTRLNRETIAAATTLTAGLTKSIGKTVAVSMTGTAALARRVGKAVSVGATFGVALTRTVGKLLAVGLTGTVGIAKRVGKTVAASTVFTVGVATVKSILRVIAVGTTFTVAVGRQAGKLIAVGITWTVGMTRSIGKLIAVGASFAGLVLKRISKSVPVATTVTAGLSVIKGVQKVIAVGASFAVGLTRGVGKPLAAGAVFVVGIAKRSTEAIAVGASFVVGVAKRIPKTIAASAVFTVAVNALKTLIRSIAVGATFTVGMARNMGKPVAVLASFTVAVGRKAGKLIAAGATFTVGIAKGMTETVAVGALFAVGVAKRMVKTIASTTTFTAALTTLKAKVVSIAVTFSGTVALTRRTGKAVAVAANFVVAVARSIGKTVAVLVAATVGLLKSTAKRVAVTVIATINVNALKTFLRTITVGATFGVGVVRSTGKGIAVTVSVAVSLLKRIGRTIPVTATFAVGLVKGVGKLVTTAAVFTLGVVRKVGKLVPVGSVVTLVVQTTKNFGAIGYTQAVAVATTVTVAIGRRANKLIGVAATFGVALTRQVRKAMAFAVPFVAVVNRKFPFRIAVSVPFTVAIGKGYRRTIAVTSAVTAALVRAVGKPVAAGVTLAMGLRRGVGKTVAAGVSFLVGTGKRIPQAIAVGVEMVMRITRGSSASGIPPVHSQGNGQRLSGVNGSRTESGLKNGQRLSGVRGNGNGTESHLNESRLSSVGGSERESERDG